MSASPGGDQPNTQEPVPVQLTRIEGTINLIAYQFGEVKEDIKELRSDSASLTMRIGAVELAQAQSTGASASWKTWLPIVIGIATVVAAFVAVYHS